jgi:hypothetical protein
MDRVIDRFLFGEASSNESAFHVTGAQTLERIIHGVECNRLDGQGLDAARLDQRDPFLQLTEVADIRSSNRDRALDERRWLDATVHQIQALAAPRS